jgi:hypothetical protein
MTNPDDRILPILEIDELVEIFEYTNRRAAVRAIKQGTFPVPVFTLAGRTVAHVDAVSLFFEEQRQASMTWLKDRYGIEPERNRPRSEPRLDLYRQLGQQARNDLAEGS